MNRAVEADIRACEVRLREAMLASDVEELDALIAPDLLFAGPDGNLATKAEDLEAHRGGASRFHEITPRQQETRVWSEDFALVSVKVFLRGVFAEQAFEGHCRYTRIWRKSPSGWQIAAGCVYILP